MSKPSPNTVTIDDSDTVLRKLASKDYRGITRTRLKASDRVIARVTDGIYRQPSSALRELISNAWDADANTVTILTDAPRFARMYIRDDGEGMSYEALHWALFNIGDSAKRQPDGQILGVTDRDNPDLTKKGRLLIGKIGIGLFSVSQLARRFRIITKVAGNDYRLIVEIRMNAHSEDTSEDDERATKTIKPPAKFRLSGRTPKILKLTGRTLLLMKLSHAFEICSVAQIDGGG